MGFLRKVGKELSRRGKRIEKDLQNLRDDLLEKTLSTSKELTITRDKNPRKLLPGIAIIINNQHFENPFHSRKGSEKDVELLKNVFQKYSIATLIIQDPTVDEIRNVINKGKFK